MKLSAKRLALIRTQYLLQLSTLCTKYRKYKWGICNIFICVICSSLMKRCYRLNPVTMRTTRIKIQQEYFQTFADGCDKSEVGVSGFHESLPPPLTLKDSPDRCYLGVRLSPLSSGRQVTNELGTYQPSIY